jgi:hypothetical protein
MGGGGVIKAESQHRRPAKCRVGTVGGLYPVAHVLPASQAFYALGRGRYEIAVHQVPCVAACPVLLVARHAPQMRCGRPAHELAVGMTPSRRDDPSDSAEKNMPAGRHTLYSIKLAASR